MLLEIKNLHVKVEEKVILKGVNLKIKGGEIHAIMGPNGAGKSTLGNVIAGRPGYKVVKGEIWLNHQNIFKLNASERAHAGIFLGFQYPIEIPGVSNAQFLKSSVDSIRKARGQDELDSMDFMQKLRTNMDILKIDRKYMKRGVNEGFSGGEKKRNEMLQMMMISPQMCILDETDSGLDIDALQIVSKGVHHMYDENRGFIVITHYQRLLNYIVPDFVHVLADGKIIKSGCKDLAMELEDKGYAWINN